MLASITALNVSIWIHITAASRLPRVTGSTRCTVEAG